MVMLPCGWRLPKSQRFRAERPSGAGRNQVQRPPSASARKGCGASPGAIAMAHPDAVAIRAAVSLVRIPPEE